MNFYVDYTNHRGIRQWREVQPIKLIMTLYPPNAMDEDQDWKYCLKCRMPDRQGAERYLSLEKCHEFREADENPALVPADVASILADWNDGPTCNTCGRELKS